jgi:hypothetical protein
VRQCVPTGATVAVASRGDDQLLRFDHATGWHFPRGDDGAYAGHYPADGAGAIAHLERLRARGAGYLVLPATALWWLEHYPAFAAHLDRHAQLIASEGDACRIYRLNGGAW